MDPLKAIGRIPIELWAIIFHFATAIEDYDEFARGPVTVIPDLSSSSPSEPCSIPHNILRDSLRTRRCLVLVCRHWYDSVLPILWSHLFINVYKWLRCRSQIRDTLDAKPELCSFIVRLDVECPDSDEEIGHLLHSEILETHLELNQFLHRYLFPRLQNLRVLRAPRSLATSEHVIYPDVTSLHSRPNISSHANCLRDRRLDMRILHLNVAGFGSRTAHEPIVFPRLNQLRLAMGYNANIIEEIVSRWQAPRLETLSISFGKHPLYTPLLAWARLTLVSLHLTDCPSFEGDRVELPKLRNLFIHEKNTRNWHTILTTPNLKVIHWRNLFADGRYSADRGAFIDLLTQMFKDYPSCKVISYYRDERNIPQPTNFIVTVRRRKESHFELNFEPPLDFLQDHGLYWN
jgi:hypothetical protein